MKKLLPLEIAATILYAASVFLFGFNPETTPIVIFQLAWGAAIVACILYVIFFYHKRLYSDMIEMGIYTPLNVIGFAGVLFYSATFIGVELPGLPTLLICIVAGVIASIAMRTIAVGLHNKIPKLFPPPASAWLDGITTGLSFIATILLILWNPLTWLFWLPINIMAIIVYWRNKAYVVMASYCLYFLNAIRGSISWYTWQYLTEIFTKG